LSPGDQRSLAVKTKLALIVAVACLGLGFAAPAFAYGPNAATVADSTSSIGPGGSLTVTGTNFAPGDTVTIVLHSAPVTLGTTTANPSGAFSVVVTIPSDTAPGDHQIVASDPDGDSASTNLMVTGTVPVATATPSLPFTGADIAALSGVGAIALALGGMLILTGRRRRRVVQ
jgi:alpha-L-fucosidase